jgi:hypothetical protein
MRIYTHLCVLYAYDFFARDVYLYASMRIYTHLCLSIRIFRFTCGFTGEMSLSQDKAVGARVIQASTHVCLGGGGAVKLHPSTCDLAPTQVGGDLLPEGGGFAQDHTKPAEFLAPLTTFFT